MTAAESISTTTTFSALQSFTASNEFQGFQIGESVFALLDFDLRRTAVITSVLAATSEGGGAALDQVIGLSVAAAVVTTVLLDAHLRVVRLHLGCQPAHRSGCTYALIGARGR